MSIRPVQTACCLSSKKNHGSCSSQDSDAGREAHGQRARARVLAASGPIHLRALTLAVPWGSCEPIGGPTFEPSDLNGSSGHFEPVSLLTCGSFWPLFLWVHPPRVGPGHSVPHLPMGWDDTTWQTQSLRWSWESRRRFAFLSPCL
jgi:hypothetical protein